MKTENELWGYYLWRLLKKEGIPVTKSPHISPIKEEPEQLYMQLLSFGECVHIAVEYRIAIVERPIPQRVETLRRIISLEKETICCFDPKIVSDGYAIGFDMLPSGEGIVKLLDELPGNNEGVFLDSFGDLQDGTILSGEDIVDKIVGYARNSTTLKTALIITPHNVYKLLENE